MRIAAIVLGLVSCGGDSNTIDPPIDAFAFGPPTGATCPPSSALTFETFGHSFMDSYCTRSEIDGAYRS